MDGTTVPNHKVNPLASSKTALTARFDTMTPEPPFLLAIDQGTTSTRAILFDADGRPAASHSIGLRQIYPANGWVEHDAEEIWQAVRTCCRNGPGSVRI